MPGPSSSPTPRSPKPTAGRVAPGRPRATAAPASIATPKKAASIATAKKPTSIATPKKAAKPASKTTSASKTPASTAKAPAEIARLAVVHRPARFAVREEHPAAEARPRPTATASPPVAVPAPISPAATHEPAPSKRTLVLMGDEVIVEVRRAQRFTLDAMAGWRAAVGKVVPEPPTRPFLLDGAEIAGSLGAVFDLADELLANQHKFVRELANLMPWA
jgi:hypothetical protein